MTSNPSTDPVLAPSLHQLNRATLIAFAVALVLLVVAVLPAEYGRDPTGIGRFLGLTQMGEMKQAEDGVETAFTSTSIAVPADKAAVTNATAPVADTPEAAPSPTPSASPTPTPSASPTPTPSPSATAAAAAKAATPPAPVAKKAVVSMTLAPNEGREIKALMKAGSTFTYSWKTDGPEVRFELHGERLDATDGSFSSYEKGTSAGEHGSFKAPFEGTHGWYWRNRTEQPVTITVTANGTFENIEAKK